MSVETEYPSKETIMRLTKELHLDGENEYTQDWEIEVANSEQLQDYIEYYRVKTLNANEKATLMRIILEAYNQYLIMNQQDEYRDLIEGLIKKDYYIHKETINYWRCAEEDSEDSFAISDLIRSVMC